MDVAPLSLGLEVAGGLMSVFIKRNTPIPARAAKMFSTNADNQTEVEVCVYEGVRAEVKHNNLLAKFSLEGIIPQAAGIPRIEVQFELDANGILSVKAEDKVSKRAANVVIENSCRLSSEDVERMVSDAKKHQKNDEEMQERTRLKLQLQSEMADLRQTIDDPNFRINKPDYDTIDNALTWLQQWMAQNAKSKEIAEQLVKLGEIVEPILSKLFKGQGLAARNMGLLFKRKRKIELLIESQPEEYKLLKAEIDKKARLEYSG